MKIGELFIALGFDIKNQKDFDNAEKGINRAAVGAGKLTIAVNAVNFALLAMLDTAGKAGQVLRNFAVTTGLSTDTLQLWQHAAAVNGISADEMTASIKRLQDAQAAFALGEPQAVGAWSMLGVNPTQDPFKVLSDLRTAMAGVQPMIARGLLARIGLENLAPMIQAPKGDFEKWSKNFVVSRDQVDRLAKLNAAWQSLKLSIASVKNLLAAALAPAFAILARTLEWVADKLAAVADWLNKGGVVATAVRWILVALALGSLALGAALAVLTAAIGALAVGFAVLSPALAATIPLLVPILGYAMAIAAVLAGLVFIIDDIVTSLTGGQAVTRTIGEWLAGFSLVRDIIQSIWDTWDEAVQHFKEGIALFERLFKHLPNWALGVTSTPPAIDNRGEAWMTPGLRSSHARAQQFIDMDIHVAGGHSPADTGREIGRSAKDEIAAAAYQMPVPSL